MHIRADIYIVSNSSLKAQHFFGLIMSLGSLELRSKHVPCNSGSFIPSESQMLLAWRMSYVPEVLVRSRILRREELSINVVKYTHIHRENRWNPNSSTLERRSITVWPFRRLVLNKMSTSVLSFVKVCVMNGVLSLRWNLKLGQYFLHFSTYMDIIQ